MTDMIRNRKIPSRQQAQAAPFGAMQKMHPLRVRIIRIRATVQCLFHLIAAYPLQLCGKKDHSTVTDLARLRG
jgi:hypothetical protein